MRNIKIAYVVSAVFLLTVSSAKYVEAQASSPNFRVNESSFSSGGGNSTSASFRSSGVAGLNGVGNASSTNFDVVVGLITPDVPFLEFGVSGAVVDLGILDPSTPSVAAAEAAGCSCSFFVRSYLSSSYVVTTISPPPTSEGNHTFAAKSTLGTPSASESVEEFGINLVANGTYSAGDDPVNQPDDGFADGIAATDYDTPNQFKYGIGDVIARAAGTANTKAWGQTDYTITYEIKSSSLTPAGLYSMDHVLVATSVY